MVPSPDFMNYVLLLHYRSTSLFYICILNLYFHSYKLFKPSCKTNLRQIFFSHRMIDPWNNLPEDTVSAPSLASFKRRLTSLPDGEEG